MGILYMLYDRINYYILVSIFCIFYKYYIFDATRAWDSCAKAFLFESRLQGMVRTNLDHGWRKRERGDLEKADQEDHEHAAARGGEEASRGG